MHTIAVINTMYSLPILVVDDDAVTRLFVEKSLRKEGFTNITCVEDGAQAVIHIKSFPPEMVIMDIFMPILDGFKCCDWIRCQPKLNDMPVLMLTSNEDKEYRYKSYEVGATDFVTKPVHPFELCARVKSHLKNKVLIKGLKLYKSTFELEMKKARELQLSVLPTAVNIMAAKESSGLEIASFMNPSFEIGGDFWGMKQISHHETALWMVDFSGHGMAAALNAFRFQSYLNESSGLSSSPGEYLNHLNDKLVHSLMRGNFATMFYAAIDKNRNQINYACACNPHPFILRQNGSVEKLDGSGTPLGISKQDYITAKAMFMPGDTLVLYSDAFIEAPDVSGKYISDDDIANLLKTFKGFTAQAIQDALLSYFQNHSHAALADDLTFCICKRMD